MVCSCQCLVSSFEELLLPGLLFLLLFIYTFSVLRYRTEFPMMRKKTKHNQITLLTFSLSEFFFSPRINFVVYSQDVIALTQFEQLMDAVNDEAP